MNSYDERTEFENPHVKTRAEIFTKPTVTAGRDFNKKADAIDRERAECQEQLDSVVNSLESGELAPTEAVREVSNIRERLLTLDSRELQLLKSFPEVRARFHDEAMREAERLESEAKKMFDKLLTKFVNDGYRPGTEAENQVRQNTKYRELDQASSLWESRAKPFQRLQWDDGRPCGQTGERWLARQEELRARIRAAVLGDAPAVDTVAVEQVKI